MDITRNQIFFTGILALFLGVELLVVESYTLTPEITQFLAKRSGHPMASVSTATQSLFQTESPPAQKTFQLPEWIGWLMVSAGSVLVLHSWGMKKTGA